MKKYLISGVVTKTIEVEADTLEEGVKLWQERAGAGYPDGWEEQLGPDDDPHVQKHGEFIGGCESCGYPLQLSDDYNQDEDGVIWCCVEEGGVCPREATR